MSVIEMFKNSSDIMKIVYFIIAKSAIRNIVMRLPGISPEMRFRIIVLVEHIFFTIWGYYVVIIHPTTLLIKNENGQLEHMRSWFFHTIDNWSVQQYPFPMFKTFYHAKIGSHLEDMMYLVITYFFPSLTFQITNSPPEKIVDKKTGKLVLKRDKKMDIHHISTAALCIGSYVTGYVKIGSIGK